MDLGLQDKVVLICGASGDVGVATAELLAEEGAALALTGRSPAPLDQLVGKLRDRGVRATGVVADLADSGQVARLVEEVESDFGPIHGLVNTVGPNIDRPQLYEDDEVWRFHFENVLMPAVRLGREVLPRMKARGAGSVVNLVATSARYYYTRLASYAAMKGAVAHVSKAFAKDVANSGVRVNTVHPGWIYKESTRRAVHEQAVAEGVSDQDVVEQWLAVKADGQFYTSRFGEPEEYARAIAFLLSDASSYVNGSWFAVDGGHAAG
ncbi:SDR family NAD(P)-dependent oxidoreductase [Streptomyces cylindrosporus]|uniref:SDR family oxidoreductase n=1 Tax=Streptomyces cylindrosporus TaxID=2927583 RepID=A0ABS9Y5Y9_9ACTN|nr:SDR family oxidoreductase [Streptomyces cylindrosporus]MCI3272414.1 SDR family oxidoreductase [Streptomyces cylindrosporus]